MNNVGHRHNEAPLVAHRRPAVENASCRIVAAIKRVPLHTSGIRRRKTNVWIGLACGIGGYLQTAIVT